MHGIGGRPMLAHVLALATASTWASIGRPPMPCMTFGSADFIRVPCPAASTMTAKAGRSMRLLTPFMRNRLLPPEGTLNPQPNAVKLTFCCLIFPHGVFWANPALVSWVRSSHYFDIGLRANFETETTLGINKLLVSFNSEIRQEHDIETVRISELGH